jgi:HemK-related putative methylase
MKSSDIFKIQNQKIKIQSNPLVFYPSPHGSKALGENIVVLKGERVLDIGTGTGILAILSAKLGGKVLAVDILQQAVDLTKQNAFLNKVDVKAIKSNLFEKIATQKFDVIIANVPQEVLSPKILNSYSSEIITGMHGFGDGSNILIRTLKKAPTFMKPTTRLYVVVYSMSGWRKGLNYIIKNYNAKLINFYSGEVKDFVYNDLNWYKNNPKIGIYKVENKWWADLFVLELRLKMVLDEVQF